MRCVVNRTGVASVTLLAAASLAAAGCTSSTSSTSVAGCSGKQAGTASAAPAGPGVAAGWTLPGGNLANTRDVASAITSANVGRLGVAWCVPVESTGLARSAGLADGYSTTPVVVNGVVYLQDTESNVMAIKLATGKVLWTHNYSSENGGPDGVNVASGVVYAATNHAAVALNAATGRQLWSRTLIGNDHEGIDMAPGYDDGTVYVSTVPVNPAVGQYLGGGKGILWALNAKTGAPEWSWDEVQNLWGNPALNSGGGLWDPPSFDAQGNLYIGIANPGPIGQTPWPKGYPWGTSRPGPDLYTDSVVKLSPAGKLIWELPVGVHSGPQNAGLLTENATPTSRIPLPATFQLEPGVFGGVESQLATNGTTVFAAVNNLAVPMSVKGVTESSAAFEAAIKEPARTDHRLQARSQGRQAPQHRRLVADANQRLARNPVIISFLDVQRCILDDIAEQKFPQCSPGKGIRANERRL